MVRIQDLLKRIDEEGTRWIDLHFVDLPGFLQEVSVPSHELTMKSFTDGIENLDCASIKGFEKTESELLLVPDPDTYTPLPWVDRTSRILCNIKNASLNAQDPRDPRYMAQRAEDFVTNSGYSKAQFGSSIDFFVFDSIVANAMTPYRGQGYTIDSREAAWNSFGQNVPVGFGKGSYTSPPQDTMYAIRVQISELLEDVFGMTVEGHHHGVATGGHENITLKESRLKKAADDVISFRFGVRNTASANGVIATFLPKPIFDDSGSGMTMCQTLWKDDVNVFYGVSDKYAALSQTARYYVGGLLEHAAALCAFTNPTTNSYKRLLPGTDPLFYIAWSRRNPQTAIQIPNASEKDEKVKRIACAVPDSSANPYYSFAGMVAAGIDGIKNKIEPGDPVDEDIRKLDQKKRNALKIKELPSTLEEAIEALEADNAFLKKVFPQEFLDAYIALKKDECIQNAIRPTAYEFQAYMGI